MTNKTTREMTITRALSELIALHKQLETYLYQTDKLYEVKDNKQREEEFNKKIISKYDQFIANFENLVTIKLAITRVNSGITKDSVIYTREIAGKQYTLSEILILRELYKKYIKRFTDILAHNINNMEQDIIKMDMTKAERVGKLIKTVCGKDTKMPPEQLAEIKKTLDTQYEYYIFNPLKLEEKLAYWNDTLSHFDLEASAIMAEENALQRIYI